MLDINWSAQLQQLNYYSLSIMPSFMIPRALIPVMDCCTNELTSFGNTRSLRPFNFPFWRVRSKSLTSGGILQK